MEVPLMELWRGPELPWVLTEEKALLPSASLYRSVLPSMGNLGQAGIPAMAGRRVVDAGRATRGHHFHPPPLPGTSAVCVGADCKSSS